MSNHDGHASLVFLSYNRPEFLVEAMQSAIQNAGEPVEVIVHDDGSDPRAVRYLLQHGSGLASRMILNQYGHNEGVGAAIRRSFDMATGDVLIKIDQDLVFTSPNWVQKIRLILDKNKKAAVEMQANPIAMLGLLHYWHEPVDSAKTMTVDRGFWTERTHVLGSGFAMPRWAYEEYGIATHSEAFAEDWDLMNRITASNRDCCALPRDDFCVNRGFGVGPSTVVVAEGQVAHIHKSVRMIDAA